jgi:protein phosphatase
MGATVVAGLLQVDRLFVAHVGDCRAYLWRNGRLQALTTDHSIVQQLVAEGSLRPEEAATHPERSRITRYAGMAGRTAVDSMWIRIRSGDRLLFCSDGLTSLVDEAAVAGRLESAPDASTACWELVAAAKAAGGWDNVSVVVVRVELGPPLGSRRSGLRRVTRSR